MVRCRGRNSSNIVWFNRLRSEGEIVGQDVGRNSEIDYSCVGINDALGGTGIIGDDPQFVDKENGDYRLQVGSPCIDTATATDLTEDLDGSPRPIDVIGTGLDGPGAFDMGAFEFQLNRADLDSNGHVNSQDLILFQGQWHEEAGSGE
jgi:hypothetical protein